VYATAFNGPWTPQPIIVGCAKLLLTVNPGKVSLTLSPGTRGTFNPNVYETEDGDEVTGVPRVRKLVISAGFTIADDVLMELAAMLPASKLNAAVRVVRLAAS
jgi:hypothetical protein